MKKYLITYFICLLFFLILFFPFLIYLYQVGESQDLLSVVKKQKNNSKKIIYGSNLHHDHRQYKKILLNESNPRIIALGSSRVLQFRQYMFTDEFINMGKGMNTINDGLDLASEINAKNIDLILLGIDFWMFIKSEVKHHDYLVKPKLNSYTPTLNDVSLLMKWMINGKVSFNDFHNTLMNGSHHIGISGGQGNGFGPDGSYYYTREISGQANNDIAFKNTSQRIKSGKNQFKYSDEISILKFNKFLKLITLLKKGNKKLILFFPPLAEPIYKQMNKMEKEYLYILKLKLKLKENEIKYYDFSSASKLDSNVGEFIDGFHGGEVTSLRILRQIMQDNIELSKFVNIKIINENIKNYSGRAFVPDEEITNLKEIDFLKVGVSKD
ncbi:MAG: hypothetical protein COA79_05745 [Planctomycetota bacterium]|nr:MAG: hypothetical protein COA79_05745 [Planctomycetota bacterium]